MGIVNIVGIGIIATILILIIKNDKPEIALLISLALSIMIFLLSFQKIYSVIEVLGKISNDANIDMTYFSILIKIIGIAYITEFGSQICRDAGSETIASKIEFVGKLFIIVISIPIIIALMELILEIMP